MAPGSRLKLAKYSGDNGLMRIWLTCAATVVCSCVFVPAAAAPQFVGIDIAPHQRAHLIRVIAKAENCRHLNNPGCIRRADGSYREYDSFEAGLIDLAHEVDRRRGHTVRWILEDFNRSGTPHYSDKVLRLDQDLIAEFVIR